MRVSSLLILENAGFPTNQALAILEAIDFELANREERAAIGGRAASPVSIVPSGEINLEPKFKVPGEILAGEVRATEIRLKFWISFFMIFWVWFLLTTTSWP